MSAAKHAACALLLSLGSGLAVAQLSVPAGAALNLAGATLNAGCQDVSVGGTLATGPGQLVGVRNIAVAGSGTLDGGSGTIGLSGDFGQSGTFNPATGTMQIGDGCGTTTSTFTGTSSFYTFNTSTATGRGLNFPANQTQSVAHALSLTGAAGALVTIRSSAAGTAGNLALAAGAAQTIAYVDVADNHATVQPIAPGAAATFNSIKGPNSNGWFVIAVSGPTGLLNDTGLTLCIDNTFAYVACTVASTGNTATYPRQDARFGRDAAATKGALTKTGGGVGGFDFTPLDTAGNPIALTGSPPVPSATPACERDNVTNLVWEVKTANGGLRDMNWYYSWFDGVSGAPSTGNLCFVAGRCDTSKYAADVNASGLCGLNTGWRLPTRRELLGIVNFGTTSPAIDGNFFPNTVSDHAFWTSDPYAILTSDIWSVEFQYGTTAGQNQPGTAFHVRLVHDGP
ncbi:MAG: DUF1566 domain-containing protein [Casimicrobiaceae bacterium]